MKKGVTKSGFTKAQLKWLDPILMNKAETMFFIKEMSTYKN